MPKTRPNRAEAPCQGSFRLGAYTGFEMKSSCERCKQPIRGDADARVCSYDCTFCSACADAMNELCPNCGGPLLAPTGAA
jgi:hypothetical protein